MPEYLYRETALPVKREKQQAQGKEDLSAKGLAGGGYTAGRDPVVAC